MANSQLFYTQVMVGKEGSWASAATPAVSIPSSSPQFQPLALRHVIDQGYRNAPGVEFDILPGPGEGMFQWAGDFFADSVPHLLMNIFGTDVVSGANPYTHAFAVSASPPSHTVQWGHSSDNTAVYQYTGGRVTQLTINFNGRDGTITYSVQGMSKLGTQVTGQTFAIGSAQAMMGWQGAITIAGSPVAAAFLEGSITFTRGVKTIHALAGTQDLTNLYPLPLQVSGQLSFDFSDLVTYKYYATPAVTTKNAVVMTFTQSSSAILAITMSKAGWRVVTPTPNDNIYTAVAQINGIYNATDVGAAACSVTNTQAAAY